jgi:hypothetical protein
MNANTAAEALLRESPAAEASSARASRLWRLVDQDGVSVHIDSGANRPRRAKHAGALRQRHPLEFQPVAAVSFDELEVIEPASSPIDDKAPSRSPGGEPSLTSESPADAPRSTGARSELSAAMRRDLIEVIQSWLGLSSELRAAILAIVRSRI